MTRNNKIQNIFSDLWVLISPPHVFLSLVNCLFGFENKQYQLGTWSSYFESRLGKLVMVPHPCNPSTILISPFPLLQLWPYCWPPTHLALIRTWRMHVQFLSQLKSQKTFQQNAFRLQSPRRLQEMKGRYHGTSLPSITWKMEARHSEINACLGYIVS